MSKIYGKDREKIKEELERLETLDVNKLSNLILYLKILNIFLESYSQKA